ncbi:hypothetical protein F-LCD7_0148 [Faustovirus]|nr:hypothetical protein F-LCD7_0148 [Faustovirus]
MNNIPKYKINQMEPVVCSISTNVGAASAIEFEVCSLEQTGIPFETCLIVPTNKFAPVGGYSIVDQSKSICLFTHTGKVYHNNIPKDEFVPLLVPLSECRMFQIELAEGIEFKFGVMGNIYSCIVTRADNPKLFIENVACQNDVFDQFAALHKKIPHRIPQRPQIQRHRSLPALYAAPCQCRTGEANEHTGDHNGNHTHLNSHPQAHPYPHLQSHIRELLVKSASRESVFDNMRGPFAPPVAHNEYDVDRVFIRSLDPISRNIVWKLRDIDANRLLIKFSQKATTYKPSPYVFSVIVIVTKRDGTQHSQSYLAPEALKLGVSLDIKDVSNIKILHAGGDLEPKSVVIIG